MANGSKVFVSPGVYTSEKDLSFVAQSVGVTTLGLVGEALKGPAFEPIFISSYDDYITRFGGTSPQTFVDSQIPKYEMGYISKAYLSQANQLFVTRVLGLSGYDAGKSWSIETIGAMDKSTVVSSTTTTHDFGWAIPYDEAGTITGNTIYSAGTGTVYTGANGVTYSGAASQAVAGRFYPSILADSNYNFMTAKLKNADGSVTSIDDKVLGFIWDQIVLTGTAITTGFQVKGDALQYVVSSV